jgi:hypothetical protein
VEQMSLRGDLGETILWKPPENRSTIKNTPIMETGIYNLTQNETRALVHFADGQTQQWLLVRLEQPSEEATQQ